MKLSDEELRLTMGALAVCLDCGDTEELLENYTHEMIEELILKIDAYLDGKEQNEISK